MRKTAARNAAGRRGYTKTVQGAFHDAHDALSRERDLTRAALAAQTERKDKLSQRARICPIFATAPAIRRTSKCA